MTPEKKPLAVEDVEAAEKHAKTVYWSEASTHYGVARSSFIEGIQHERAKGDLKKMAETALFWETQARVTASAVDGKNKSLIELASQLRTAQEENGKLREALKKIADADTWVGNIRRFTLADCICFARAALQPPAAGERGLIPNPLLEEAKRLGPVPGAYIPVPIPYSYKCNHCGLNSATELCDVCAKRLACIPYERELTDEEKQDFISEANKQMEEALKNMDESKWP